MLIAAASTSFITAAIITAMPFIHVRGSSPAKDVQAHPRLEAAVLFSHLALDVRYQRR